MRTTALPTIDKYTAVRSIRHLMEQARLNTRELEELLPVVSAPPAEELPAWKQELLSLAGSVDPVQYPFFENPTKSVRQLRDLEQKEADQLNAIWKE